MLTKVLNSPCHRIRTTPEMIWNDLPQKPVAKPMFTNAIYQLTAAADTVTQKTWIDIGQNLLSSAG